MTDSLYQEIILDHYQHPRHAGLLSNPTGTVNLNNPLCGDTITLTVKEIDGVIADIGFEANGCAISVASASLLADYAIGKSKDALQKLDKNFIVELLGITLSPNRLKCALLPLEAVSNIISTQHTHERHTS
jgi:nitrogen fixation protein NifU and related proteins